MYCNKCGALVPDGAAVCPTCGAPMEAAPAADQYAYAQPAADPYAQPAADPYAYQQPAADPYAQPAADPYAQPAADPYAQQAYNQQQYYGQQAQQAFGQAPGQPKSKMIAGILAICLGSFGIHNFYLGYTKKAVIQLVLTLVGGWLFGLGALAAWIWAIIDAVNIFTGKMPDANGVPLTDN